MPRARTSRTNGVPCPECHDDRLYTSRGLTVHRRLKHGTADEAAPAPSRAAERRTAASSPRSSSSGTLEEEGGKLVTNLTMCAGFLSLLLPVTGATIIRRLGDRQAVDPISQQPIMVDGRPTVKRGIARVIMDAARTDERILDGVRKFNRFFEIEDALELGASLVAAAAVDVLNVDPHMAIDAGPIGRIAPIEQLIGDVVEELEIASEDQVQDEPTRPAGSSNGVAPDGATVVLGGVQQT